MIQSTVAGAMELAMAVLMSERDRLGLNFKIINQIHDAFLILTPEDEVEKTVELIRLRMPIPIPLPAPLDDGSTYLNLRVDVDVYDRWGEDIKKP